MSIVSTKTALLQALTVRDSYPDELIARVRRATNGRVTMPDGSVYPALDALRREGLIAPAEGPPSRRRRAGRQRQYFALTAKGAAQAKRQRAALRKLADLGEA